MYEIKYALPSVNLSYANLITVLVKESRREEGNSHPPSQRFRIFLYLSLKFSFLENLLINFYLKLYLKTHIFLQNSFFLLIGI